MFIAHAKAWSVLTLSICMIAVRGATDPKRRERSELDNVATADPTIKTIAEHEVMYVAPKTNVKGILFFAHGCHHSAGDAFKPSAACKHCLGLPEERHIVNTTLKRGYVFLAVSSADRHSMCWAVHKRDLDLSPVAKIITEVAADEGWDKLPVYALGASSGGGFVLVLPSVMKLSGICPQIMGLMPRHLESILVRLEEEGSWKYPPTVFHHMVRDHRTAHAVKGDINVLTNKGVPVKEVAIHPLPLHESFFSDRIEDFPADVSAKMVQELKNAQWLHQNGSLLFDPRSTVSHWQEILTTQVPGIKGMALEADAAPIYQELNVAFASHEIISDHVDAMFHWFESQPKAEA